MKRILIINSNSISLNDATGITLQSIFGELDSEKLMELYWNKNAELSQGVKINSRLLRYRFCSLGYLLSNKKSRQISTSIRQKVQSTAQKTSEKALLLKWLRQFVYLQSDCSEIAITKKNIKEIISFKPEVIYTLGGSVAVLRTVYRLSKKLDVPIVIHFMDNWRHHIQWEDNPLLKGYKRKLDKYCKLCYSRSRHCIAISPKMAKVYTEETGIKHSYIMNSVRVADYICAPKEKSDTINFVYAGGLHLGRNNALAEIGSIIDEISTQKAINAKLLIFTSQENINLHQGEFEALKNTRLLPAVAHDNIKEVYEQADVLVHIESNALVGNGFFKYSISTKIPEYLATGKSMLFYGPSNIYLYEFLKENSLAYVADDKEKLIKRIDYLVSNKGGDLSKNGVCYAKEHFDVKSAVKTLNKVIDDSVMV